MIHDLVYAFWEHVQLYPAGCLSGGQAAGISRVPDKHHVFRLNRSECADALSQPLYLRPAHARLLCYDKVYGCDQSSAEAALKGSIFQRISGAALKVRTTPCAFLCSFAGNFFSPPPQWVKVSLKLIGVLGPVATLRRVAGERGIVEQFCLSQLCLIVI